MQVTLDVRDRVISRLTSGLLALEVRYGKVIPMPVLRYDLSGTTAGTANYIQNLIRFNSVLLMENIDLFIERTVPHELAHIACHHIYPDAYVTRYGEKREVHGPRFRELMAAMGADDDSRCHSYSTETVARPKSKFLYECVKCKREYTVGIKTHSKLAETKRGVCHCGSSVMLKQELGKVTYAMARQIVAGDVDPVVVVKEDSSKLRAPTPGSKLHRCWELYLNYGHRNSRGTMINMFVDSAGCTTAGASTYHASLKKIYDAGIR